MPAGSGTDAVDAGASALMDPQVVQVRRIHVAVTVEITMRPTRRRRALPIQADRV